MLAIQYRPMPAETNRPRYRLSPTEITSMLYLLIFPCSACSAWERFCVTVITRELRAARIGTRMEIPPFSLGTHPRLIPRNISSWLFPRAIRFRITSTRPSSRISCTMIGSRPASGLYFSCLYSFACPSAMASRSP